MATPTITEAQLPSGTAGLSDKARLVVSGSGKTMLLSDLKKLLNLVLPAVKAYSTSIDLSDRSTVAQTQTINGPVTYTPNTGTARDGGHLTMMVIANGVNFPNLSAWTRIGPDNYSNVTGRQNLLRFSRTAGQYFVEVIPALPN